jgi:hypothetical protein
MKRGQKDFQMDYGKAEQNKQSLTVKRNMEEYLSSEFEIITMTKTPIGNNFRTKTYKKQIQISKNGMQKKVSKLNDGAAIKFNSIPSKKTYYKIDKHYYIAIYPRILIRRKVL